MRGRKNLRVINLPFYNTPMKQEGGWLCFVFLMAFFLYFDHGGLFNQNALAQSFYAPPPPLSFVPKDDTNNRMKNLTPKPEAGNPPSSSAHQEAGLQPSEKQEIISKPALILKGYAKWDDGLSNLRQAFLSLEAQKKQLGLLQDGQLMVYSIENDDIGFHYEAMLPLKAVPLGQTFHLSQGMSLGVSPAGLAVIFPYEGVYDELDAAYESIASWLDEKNYVSTNKFLEEYENFPQKEGDEKIKAKIIIFIK